MQNGLIARTCVAAGMALAFISLAALPALPQTAKPAAKSAIKRMPDGHPDLQGTYDLATMTPMERMPGDPPVLSKEQAEKIHRKRRWLAAMPMAGSSIPIAAPSRSAATRPAENRILRFWKKLVAARRGWCYDRLSGSTSEGTAYTMVDGQIRTSIVIDPPDGRVPPFNAAAKKRRANAFGLPTSDTGESQDVRAATRRGEFDNPEERPLSERCLLGFGSTSGPPALPDYFYNDMHQIVQTPDTIMILTEMIHDARIVRMNGQHLPKNIRRWMGDSVGHWEGDTLVIDTTNFTDKTRFRGSTENLHVVERRLTRIDDKTLSCIASPSMIPRPGTVPGPAK